MKNAGNANTPNVLQHEPAVDNAGVGASIFVDDAVLAVAVAVDAEGHPAEGDPVESIGCCCWLLL